VQTDIVGPRVINSNWRVNDCMPINPVLLMKGLEGMSAGNARLACPELIQCSHRSGLLQAHALCAYTGRPNEVPPAAIEALHPKRRLPAIGTGAQAGVVPYLVCVHGRNECTYGAGHGLV
jgi:hypothetical protein